MVVVVKANRVMVMVALGRYTPFEGEEEQEEPEEGGKRELDTSQDPTPRREEQQQQEQEQGRQVQNSAGLLGLPLANTIWEQAPRHFPLASTRQPEENHRDRWQAVLQIGPGN